MKPLLILLTFVASLITAPSFAKDKGVTPSILKSFNTTFNMATDVEWTTTENLYKARFVLNGQVVNAYYSTDGEMLAVTRNITSQQLPLTLQTKLKKEYGEYWITDLFELNNDAGTGYYITLETSENKLILQSVNNNWSLYSKTKKD